MPTLELNPETYARLALLARAWGVTPAIATGRLIDEFADGASRGPTDPPRSPAKAGERVEIHFEYRGERVEGLFDPRTHAVEVTRGPGVGQHFRSPSSAAVAAVTALNPTVSPNRNGWSTWRISDTGELLQSLRS